MLTKIIFISAFNLSLVHLADAVNKAAPTAPPTLVFWIFIGMMMTLELFLILSPGFRNWLKTGVENGDGVLNAKDINGLIIYYASLWFLRLFILNHLLEKFYHVDTDFEQQLLLFFGATGSQGIGVLRTFIIKRTKQ